MTATMRLKDVLEQFPGFKPGWTLTVNGEPVEGDWIAKSRFGSVGSVVVMHEDGTPNFDRPYYEEAPAVNVIAFGIRWKRNWLYRWRREVRIAFLHQPRPHADDPLHLDIDGHPPVVVGQIPMGFAEKILGGKFESSEAAASREVREETGATAVMRTITLRCPWHNPNPTFVKSWTDVLFVEVNLDKVESLKASRNEPIYSAEYVLREELDRRIYEGIHEGAYYRAGTSLSALSMFDAWFRRHYR